LLGKPKHLKLLISFVLTLYISCPWRRYQFTSSCFCDVDVGVACAMKSKGTPLSALQWHNCDPSILGRYSPIGPWRPPLRFLYHTRNQTHGTTPLDKWSARRRGLYLHKTQSINTDINIHALSGIRTRDPSSKATAELSLRPRGHWDRHITVIGVTNFMKLCLAVLQLEHEKREQRHRHSVLQMCSLCAHRAKYAQQCL
jgi:hypothetical protein